MSEVELWRAVINHAITDATATIPKSTKRKNLAQLTRWQARRWLIDNSRDFREVCSLALLDSEAVRDKGISLSKLDWPSTKRF